MEGEAAGVCAELGLPLPLGVARREAPGRRLAGALLAALEQPERDLPIPLTASLKARAPRGRRRRTQGAPAARLQCRAHKVVTCMQQRAAPVWAGRARMPPSRSPEAGRRRG